MYLQPISITASKFACTWPPSPSTHLLDHWLQVHLKTRLIRPSKCISNVTQLQPSSVSLNYPNYGLQVHVQRRSITASKCISELLQLWPGSASTNRLDYGLQSASPNLLDHSLQNESPILHNRCRSVCLWVHSIVIFWCISSCSEAPPAASPDIPCVDG